MKLTTGYKKPIASSGTDALELSSNNSYLLLAGGGHKALSELVSPADLTTELSNYVTIGSNQTITGVKTFSLAINADITGNADTVDGEHAAAFAHIGAHNNLTASGNEFTFASNGFSGDIWLNYRTAEGANGNITDYIFGNGKGGQLYSLKTIASNASAAYSWGNHANVGYLLRSDIGSLSVNYATNAGNAGTLNGHTSNDFVLKTTHDVYESVIAEALNDLDSRKADIEDIPTSLPANGGNADYAESAGNAGTLGGYHESAFSKNGHTHTTSEITNFPTIGNGALHIKVNGTELTPEGGIFTANKGGDSTIDLTESLATRPEINTLGGRVDKIDTSITKLNTAIQVKNPIDDSDEGDEETTESNNEPFINKIGIITLNFWTKVKYTDLPVYDVWVNHVADVIEPFGSVSYCYDIFLVIGITDSIESMVGFTPGNYKPFFIRGANVNNEVCGFDVRGNGNINTARATITGGYMHLQCRLKLHGGDSGTGNDIMQKAANEQFDAYLCLRQTP